jgi:DNA-binding transcriptional ArsR family regulator
MAGPKKTKKAQRSPQGFVVSDEKLRLIAGQFKLLADPTRLRILHILQSGERTVTEVLAATGTSQGNISKHLGVLARGRLISRRKEGLNAYYAITDPIIFELCDLMCNRQKS